MAGPDPLILTALLDPEGFAELDGLRRRFFPAALNRVAAHVTLFHHLPGAELRTIADHLSQTCTRSARLRYRLAETVSLGRGVALRVDCPGLVALRAGLATRWQAWLTPQDRQGYRPHVTIQNKVGRDDAVATRLALDALLPMHGAIEGLALWHYRGGPWEEAGRFDFAR